MIASTMPRDGSSHGGPETARRDSDTESVLPSQRGRSPDRRGYGSRRSCHVASAHAAGRAAGPATAPWPASSRTAISSTWRSSTRPGATTVPEACASARAGTTTPTRWRCRRSSGAWWPITPCACGSGAAGRPRFEICELGAGNGQLCLDTLLGDRRPRRRRASWQRFRSGDALPHRRAQRRRWSGASGTTLGPLAERVTWHARRPGPARRSSALRPRSGLIVANEVLDCLPHHKLVGTARGAGVVHVRIDVDRRPQPGPSWRRSWPTRGRAIGSAFANCVRPLGGPAGVARVRRPVLSRAASLAPRGAARVRRAAARGAARQHRGCYGAPTRCGSTTATSAASTCARRRRARPSPDRRARDAASTMRRAPTTSPSWSTSRWRRTPPATPAGGSPSTARRRSWRG